MNGLTSGTNFVICLVLEVGEAKLLWALKISVQTHPPFPRPVLSHEGQLANLPLARSSGEPSFGTKNHYDGRIGRGLSLTRVGKTVIRICAPQTTRPQQT